MAEQSAFLKAYDDMQKKKGGFNAPAPQESVVDTVGQAPAVQSPFGQQAGLLALKQPYGGVDFRGDPRPTSNEIRSLGDERQRDSVENSGTFTQGLERAANFIYGDWDEPFETRSELAKQHSATYYRRADEVQDREQMVLNQNPMLAPQIPLAAPIDLAAAPAVQAPAVQAETPFFQPTESGQRLASGVSSAKDAVFNAANSVSEAGGNFANSTSGAVADLINQSTGGRVNLQSPSASGAATKDNAGAPITDASQLRAFMSGLNEESAASEPAATLAPEVPAPAVVAASPAEVTPAGATPAVAAPVMNGSQIPQAGEEGFKFAERGSPQDYFLSNTNGGTTALSPEQITRGQEYAKQQGLNFDPATGFSQSTEAPQVQAPQGLTTAGGQPLAEFLAGGQQKDAQGRMIDPNVDRSSFEKDSAAREARQAARPDFGTAVSDRDRRAARGDGISDADRRDIAKANRQGASAGDIARGDKVAAANGIDRRTGEQLEAGVSALDKARTTKANAETAKIISDINSANDTSNWDDGKKQAMKTQAKELAVWEINELPKLEKNISQLRAVSDALDLGKIKTGGLGDQIPGLSNWARPFLNPDAEVAKQEVSGVIMQTLKETFPGAISDGERKALIDTIFNPQLKPEDNAKLIIGYTDRLSKAMNAKVAQVKHFREFGNLEGYTGITPRDALMSGIPGTGAGGSPIEGDVNYQSDTQNKAQSLLGAQ